MALETRELVVLAMQALAVDLVLLMPTTLLEPVVTSATALSEEASGAALVLVQALMSVLAPLQYGALSAEQRCRNAGRTCASRWSTASARPPPPARP